MTVEDLILEIYGEIPEPESAAQKETLKRRVIVKSGANFEYLIREVRFDIRTSTVIIEI